MLLSWIPFYVLWFTYDRLSPLHGLSQTVIGKLILHHTFFVYVFHDPLMSIIKWSLLYIYNSHIWLQPIVYLMLPIILYVLLAIMAEGFKVICPKGYATLMGER